MIRTDRMAAVDRNATALGVTQQQLMESAGNAVAGAVRDLAPPGTRVVVLAGRGNNGGDGLAAARYLSEYEVAVHLLGRPSAISSDVSKNNWTVLQNAEIPTRRILDSTAIDLGNPAVVVDGILGTGVTGPPREPERSAVEAVNATDADVVSVDVPSGMDADTGKVADVAVAADRVVTFHDRKPGLDGRDDVIVADIGIPDAAETFVGPGDRLVLDRPEDSHKGDFGRVTVIGGGPYTGAPALAGQAALRAGADLAYVVAPESVADEIQGYSEDLIVEPVAGTRFDPGHVDDILERTREREVVLLGPGLGDAPDTHEAVAAFLESYDGRAVVDADALATVPDVQTDATLVCTPHRGELVEMGGPSAEEWRERATLVEEFAESLGHTLLVKGAYDVVSDGETTRVNRTGNPGMTVGGTGDVLAGATAALLAQLEPRDAAALAAYANGIAGDRVVDAEGFGLLATDLLDELPSALWGDRR